MWYQIKVGKNFHSKTGNIQQVKVSAEYLQDQGYDCIIEVLDSINGTVIDRVKPRTFAFTQILMASKMGI